MFLARREIGKRIRVYPLYMNNDQPTAWAFDCTNPEVPGTRTAAADAAGCASGVSATGHTRGEAVVNLGLAEEAAAHA